MKYYRLIAPTQPYLWGGKKLFNFGKKSSDDIIAESWELSFLKEGKSEVEIEGVRHNLEDILSPYEYGSNYTKYSCFPVLIKFIDSNKDLSVQVHPSDEYALKYEHSLGKTEMWYIIDSEPDSYIYVGLNDDYSKEEILEKIKNGNILDIMNHIKVKKGDCFYIPSGTLHAIGKGCLICEIQENSNLTYRVYDYHRVDKNGKERELHIDKAIAVINTNKYNPISCTGSPLVDNQYFSVDYLKNEDHLKADKKSFVSLHIISGSGHIENEPFKTGDSFFIPADTEINLSGTYEAITCRIN